MFSPQTQAIWYTLVCEHELKMWRILLLRKEENKNGSRQQEKLALRFDFLCFDFHKDSEAIYVDLSVEHPKRRNS